MMKSSLCNFKVKDHTYLKLAFSTEKLVFGCEDKFNLFIIYLNVPNWHFVHLVVDPAAGQCPKFYQLFKHPGNI